MHARLVHEMTESSCSALTGLLMAIKDPKVPIFMLMCCSQLLGLSFVNFFPTYVPFPLYDRSLLTSNFDRCRIAGTLGFSTTVTLLLAAYVFGSPSWLPKPVDWAHSLSI